MSVRYETRVPNSSNITAATGRDAVFHTIPTVCDSVPWMVEVSKGYHSVHIYVCANEGFVNQRLQKILGI